MLTELNKTMIDKQNMCTKRFFQIENLKYLLVFFLFPGPCYPSNPILEPAFFTTAPTTGNYNLSLLLGDDSQIYRSADNGFSVGLIRGLSFYSPLVAESHSVSEEATFLLAPDDADIFVQPYFDINLRFTLRFQLGFQYGLVSFYDFNQAQYQTLEDALNFSYGAGIRIFNNVEIDFFEKIRKYGFINSSDLFTSTFGVNQSDVFMEELVFQIVNSNGSNGKSTLKEFIDMKWFGSSQLQNIATSKSLSTIGLAFDFDLVGPPQNNSTSTNANTKNGNEENSMAKKEPINSEDNKIVETQNKGVSSKEKLAKKISIPTNSKKEEIDNSTQNQMPSTQINNFHFYPNY